MTLANPTLPVPDFSAIPAALRDRPQWLCWRLEEKPGGKKPAKMPYYASGKRRTGVQGSDADRAALVPLDQAIAAMTALQASGIGFAFLPDDGLIGIDLDKMADPASGEIAPRAQSIIDSCASYTEWSPSGKGFHIYVLGETATTKDNGIGVEMFCGRQFFTVTGRHLSGTPHEVSAIDDKVLRRLRATIDAAKGKAKTTLPPSASVTVALDPASDRARIQSALEVLDAGMGYDDWLQIGMALHAALGAEGLGVWDTWSARADKYAGARAIEAHWKSFKPGRVGIATLFHHAKRAGWIAPRGWKPKPVLSPPGAPAGEATVTATPSNGSRYWRVGLWRSETGHPKAVRENVVHMLAEHPALAQLVAHNVFANRIELTRPPPWGRKSDDWKPRDTAELAEWLANEIGALFKLKEVADAVALAAWRNVVNPVQDHFERLPAWDGANRLEYWLSACLGALDTPYHRLVGRLYLMGLVKRVLHPGCKFDYMLILEGPQGRGKSSVFRLLALKDEWFNDTPFSHNLDKDARLALQGTLVYEVSEMHSFNQADSKAIKAFLSQMEDRLRTPYAEQVETFKRTLVFGGTTNENEYFRDSTGNRRFWPVPVGAIDLLKLASWLPQLYAEALHRVRAGEQTYPSRDEDNTLCAPEQAARMIPPTWTDFIRTWLAKPECYGLDFVTYQDVFEGALKLEPARLDHFGNAQKHLRESMKALGWEMARKFTNGVQDRGFKKLAPPTEALRVAETDIMPI